VYQKIQYVSKKFLGFRESPPPNGENFPFFRVKNLLKKPKVSESQNKNENN